MSSRARRRKWSKERPPNLSDLRIVLLGKSVSENSRVGNFILGRAAFDSEAPPDVVERVGGRLKDRHLMIINSPQLLQTNISDHQITQTVRECVFLSDPGPHVFIIILQYKDFTEEDLRRVKYMLDRFSEEAIKRSVVITTDEEAKANEFMQRLTAECGGGHLQLDRENEECCSIILQRLEQILRENSEEFLTCELYHDAQETLVDEDQGRSSSLRTDEEDSDGAASGTRQQKLNLVLCGSDETLKNSISNLIKQKRRDVELHAHLMNLVELPALTRLSEEEVMRQTLSCVSLCDPGVHIFLFIVPDAPLNNEDKAEMEEIQRIFSSRINKHIMILIKQDSEHQTEELSEETQSVIESFGGRHHFFGPKTQVSTLMKNIEQMLEENRGGFFSTETFLEAQMKKLMKYEEMKRKINSLETHLLSQVSRENTDNEVRIVLLGKTGVGKSATGNTILGREAFTAETSQESVTKESQRESSEINGRRVTVIDTPGLFDTELSNEEIQREIRHCISMILPGPHVFIIVLNLGQQFTQEAATSVTLIQETFGEKSLMYTMVLFTRGDDLKDKTIDEFLGKPGSPLMKLIKACGNRYHVFNNIPTEDRTQVTDLLQKIDNMLKENGGSFYSCKMFREMEREKQEQQMKILMERLREREEEMKKERETFKHETEQLKQENKKVKTEKEKLQIKYNTETERLMNRIENERKKREEELNEREERYKTLMKEKEESEEKMCEEMKREREEWEKQKLEEKMRREEEDERRREEEQYKTLMKVREEKKRKMFEQMKLEPMQWGKWKQYEVQKREQEKIEQEKQKFELYKQQQSPLRDYGMMQIRQSVPVNIQDTPVSRLPFRRIVLLGKTGVGKSAAGNTILGRKEFRSEISWTAVTSECSAAHTVSGRSVTVVDTPGFFHTHMKHEESMTEIERSVYLSSPGPHAFLIVFPVNLWFTEHEQQILQQIPQQIEMLFGQEVLKYSIILFTHGDLLEGNSIHTLIEKISPLRHLVDQCGGRYHVFNNRDQSNREQVTGLLEKIDTMIEQNGGGHYRNQMFQDAQRFRRGEKQSQGCVCS